MLQKYICKLNRQIWSIQIIEGVLNPIKYKSMGWFLASNTFNVPQISPGRHAECSRGSNKRYLGTCIPSFDGNGKRFGLPFKKFKSVIYDL